MAGQVARTTDGEHDGEDEEENGQGCDEDPDGEQSRDRDHPQETGDRPHDEERARLGGREGSRGRARRRGHDTTVGPGGAPGGANTAYPKDVGMPARAERGTRATFPWSGPPRQVWQNGPLYTFWLALMSAGCLPRAVRYPA